jgi:STAS-like domain of unknown function (DUF4325)
MVIKILPAAGSFAENKDIARELRLDKLLPALDKQQEVTIDFRGVDGATQSFIHALISDAIRAHGNEVLDHIVFKNCNETIRQIINIVITYMQES